MPHPLYPGTITAAANPAGGRRQFLGGLALTGAGLAGGVAAIGGPQWPGQSRDRPMPPIMLSAAVSPPPPPLPSLPRPAAPRPVEHGAEARRQWQAFRHQYVTPEGRILDTGNGNVSHSEGQGWGLMGAQACDDPASFATILDWTEANLQRRSYDSLHAWRYKPGDSNPVADLNNATDGDLFIAAALARAAVRWNRPDYASRAARIAADILALVRQAGARTLLLPGAAGFEAADAYTLNPSYYAFALFPDLAALAPSLKWESLRRDGLALMLQGRFGKWQLPPDWLRVSRADGSLSIAQGWPPRFSYDAIRVPLHLAWAGLPAGPLFDSFRRYWAGARIPPGWVDLRTDAVAPYAAPAGLRAVAAVITRPANLGLTVPLPSVMGASDYYSAGLILLSQLALGESRAV